MSIRSSRQQRASVDGQASMSQSSVNDSPDRTSRHGARPVPKHTTAAAASSHIPSSSSSVQRPHARSFVSQYPLPSTDPAQYSSQGVREQTSELASFVIADVDILQTNLSPRQRTTSTSTRSSLNPSQRNDDRSQSQPWDRSEAAQLVLPEVIEEHSEPSTPHSAADASATALSEPDQPATSKRSGLASLFGSYKFPSYGTLTQSPRRSSENKSKDAKAPQIPEQAIDQEGSVGERDSLLNRSTHVPDPLPRRNTRRLGEGLGATSHDVEGQKWTRRKRNLFWQLSGEAKHRVSNFFRIATSPKSWNAKVAWQKGIKEPIGLLPCVFLGLLLNILDALSYGLILFPLGEPIFEKTGPDGISMFYLSCIVSQLVFSFGGSIFKGAVGSEMIEVVPFFHKMTYTIMAKTGTSRPEVVLATTITSYAMSSIITGIVFFCLGAFKLGSLVSFFPRHILIGCVGGVGFFLFVTGIEVSARLEGNLEYNLDTVKALLKPDTLALWLVPLALSILLTTVLHIKHSPYITPVFFVAIAVIFYIVVAAVTSLNVELLREKGWIFGAVESGVPFYHFYSYYDFRLVDWEAVAAAVPAMFALTFFGVLHVPINIPALAITAEEDDLNLNRELIGHGVSNALSGFVGSIQNYLVYVNSAMFIENGGNNRLAGILLAAATFGVWVAGPAMIGYVPIMVVGALIFYLGIALLEEALYDTWGKMSKLEYLTVLAIVLVMGIYDFVGGILVGIVLACLNFVVQTSRKPAIRATYSGEIVESTVRRHPIQRHFLHEVGYQIYVTKLAGFLFFGSIVTVEKNSRALIDEEAFYEQPIRFLVFDLFHVSGIDYSAVEAFSRLERVLGRRDVRMVISGLCKDSDIGKSLRSIGLWNDDSSVSFFETLNDALEYCENELLRALYKQRDALGNNNAATPHDTLDIPKPEDTTSGSSDHLHDPALQTATPRTNLLAQAATTALGSTAHHIPTKWATFKQPLPLILQSFQDLTDKNEDFWFKAVGYFSRAVYPAGTTIYNSGEAADAFYLLEEGILRAEYDLPVGTYHESIVAGTTCGELPFFSATLRTARVSAERDCVAWRLGLDSWGQMQTEWPEGAAEVLKIAMKLTKERVDAVVGYVLTAAG